MLINLRINKKNITALLLAVGMTFVSGCSGKNTKPEPTETLSSTIYMIDYNPYNRELCGDEITQDELEAIPEGVIALQEVDGDILYVASYQALGYEAAKKNDTKIEARKNNPEYAQNIAFSEGYDLGKKDRYLEQAQDEHRPYVGIRPETNEEMEAETYYYPLEELTVVSYDGINAIVRNYNEDNIKLGNYEDLLGQDMSNYIGQEFTATSLWEFATENVYTLQEAIYIAASDYQYIAEITPETMSQVKGLTKTK